MVKKSKFWQTFELKNFKRGFIFFVCDFHRRKIFFQKARAFFIFLKSAGKANIFICFLQKAIFLPLKVKISKKLIIFFGQFYVTYRNIVQFEYNLWKLDYFEKGVLELMADPIVVAFWQLRSLIYAQTQKHLIFVHFDTDLRIGNNITKSNL